MKYRRTRPSDGSGEAEWQAQAGTSGRGSNANPPTGWMASVDRPKSAGVAGSGFMSGLVGVNRQGVPSAGGQGQAGGGVPRPDGAGGASATSASAVSIEAGTVVVRGPVEASGPVTITGSIPGGGGTDNGGSSTLTRGELETAVNKAE